MTERYSAYLASREWALLKRAAACDMTLAEAMQQWDKAWERLLLH